MKVSAQEEYGLRCLLQLAPLGEGEYLTLTQIAEREGISVANAGKLLWILNKAGLVSSIRGTKGGYRLARAASEARAKARRSLRSRRLTKRLTRRKMPACSSARCALKVRAVGASRRFAQSTTPAFA